MKTEQKSQLAKDLSHALFVCGLRDDLFELSEDASLHVETRRAVNNCYVKSVVALVCSLQDSEELKHAMGAE